MIHGAESTRSRCLLQDEAAISTRISSELAYYYFDIIMTQSISSLGMNLGFPLGYGLIIKTSTHSTCMAWYITVLNMKIIKHEARDYLPYMSKKRKLQ